jgi:hypothetical protein
MSVHQAGNGHESELCPFSSEVQRLVTRNRTDLQVPGAERAFLGHARMGHDISETK